MLRLTREPSDRTTAGRPIAALLAWGLVGLVTSIVARSAVEGPQALPAGRAVVATVTVAGFGDLPSARADLQLAVINRGEDDVTIDSVTLDVPGRAPLVLDEGVMAQPGRTVWLPLALPLACGDGSASPADAFTVLVRVTPAGASAGSSPDGPPVAPSTVVATRSGRPPDGATLCDQADATVGPRPQAAARLVSATLAGARGTVRVAGLPAGTVISALAGTVPVPLDHRVIVTQGATVDLPLQAPDCPVAGDRPVATSLGLVLTTPDDPALLVRVDVGRSLAAWLLGHARAGCGTPSAQPSG